MVLDETGEVIIDNDEHLAALDFYTQALAHAPEGASQVDWAAAQNLFNQGQLAMTKFWAHAYPQIPDDSPIKGKVGAAPMIAGEGGLGGVAGRGRRPWPSGRCSRTAPSAGPGGRASGGRCDSPPR